MNIIKMLAKNLARNYEKVTKETMLDFMRFRSKLRLSIIATFM